MAIFIILFIYLLVLRVLFKGKRLTLCVLSSFGLWLVLALRSPYCGIDLLSGGDESSNYYNMFMRISDYSFLDIFNGELSYYSHMEIGWLMYCKIVSNISTHFQIFLALTALLQMFLLGFVFYHFSKDIVLSYIVYFCFGLYVLSFSGLRQAMAYDITFFSFYFLIKDKNWQFVLLVLIASTMHSSAIIFLLAFPMKYIRLDVKRSIIALIGIFAMLPLLYSFINTVVPLLFADRYNYFQDEGGAITLFLLYVVICVFALKIKLKSKYDSILRCLVLLAAACQSLGYIGAGAITRIGYFFSIMFTLLFPELMMVYSNKNEREYLSPLVSALFMLYFYLVNGNGYLNVVPYKFFWEVPFNY